MGREYFHYHNPPVEILGAHVYPTIFTINKNSLSDILAPIDDSLNKYRIEMIGGTEYESPVKTLDHYQRYNPHGELVIRVCTQSIHEKFRQRFRQISQFEYTVEKNNFIREYVGKELTRTYGKLVVSRDGLPLFASTTLPTIGAFLYFTSQSNPLSIFGSAAAAMIGYSSYKLWEDRTLTNFTNQHWRDISSTLFYNPANELGL